MPRYKLRLHDGPSRSPLTESIELDGDDDARDIAQVTLLMTRDYSHVEVYRDAALLGSFKRDSRRVSPPGQGPLALANTAGSVLGPDVVQEGLRPG
ncbi:hypothetical protein BZG35_14240 [Brevundimonas sp. LM2]|uniref:hypothetical protein n=1 Tax=Brevundimonas sp. LM2 TaxID=1938605 RepID=UPI000983B259|nr:hypothetical protein [Brevundimonas sp. LM2]AQR62677.1 hypothetical protein BZG35_14240 [Brevundimonas sp. LM2]